jgi:hypothetical protein
MSFLADPTKLASTSIFLTKVMKEVQQGGYLSLDGTHLSIPWNGKNIIVLREGIISPYIEIIPQSTVNYI